MKLLILLITPFICYSAEQIKIVFLNIEKEDRLTIYRFDSTTKEALALECVFAKLGGSYNEDSIKTKKHAEQLVRFMITYGYFSKEDEARFKANPLELLGSNAYFRVERFLLTHGFIVTAFDTNDAIFTAYLSKSVTR